MQDVSEADLISRSKQGNLSAFNRLVENYQDRVYNVALRMLGDSATAEDITQDTFISVFKSISHFRGGSFQAWILRITTNRCYDELRSKHRHPTSSLDQLDSSGRTLIEPVDGATSPEDQVLQEELAQTVEKGLTAIPAEQRLVLILSDIQGFSYEEISQVIGRPVGTVKSRLSRARSELRDYLLEQRELLPSQYRLTSKAVEG